MEKRLIEKNTLKVNKSEQTILLLTWNHNNSSKKKKFRKFFSILNSTLKEIFNDTTIPLRFLYDENIGRPKFSYQKKPFEYIVPPPTSGIGTNIHSQDARVVDENF